MFFRNVLGVQDVKSKSEQVSHDQLNLVSRATTHITRHTRAIEFLSEYRTPNRRAGHKSLKLKLLED